jgi:hypothetical protein
MTAARKLLMTAPAAGGFNPETDIAWHSLFWAEGTAFSALSYADGASVTSWPNETAESDASTVSGTAPVFDAVNASLGGASTVSFGGAGDLATGSFTTALPTGTKSIVVIGQRSAGLAYVGRNTGGFWLASEVDNGKWRSYFGGDVIPDNRLDFLTDPALHVTVFRSTGSSYFVNNSTDTPGGGTGVASFVDMRIGAGAGRRITANIAFVGGYAGDITLDSSYADLKTWVTGHYGITIA